MLFGKKKEVSKMEYPKGPVCYCFLGKDEDRVKVLKGNPKFEMSTKELIEAGYSGRAVYRYYPEYKHGISLEPEPSNKNDPNAVKVLINGEFFGYVNREDAPVIKSALKNGIISNVALKVSGGSVRRVFENGQSTADRYDLAFKLHIEYK